MLMKSNRLFRTNSFLTATLAAPVATLLLSTAPSALATTYTWVGGANVWNNALSWDANGVPPNSGTTNDVVINNTTLVGNMLASGSSYTLRSLTFGSGNSANTVFAVANSRSSTAAGRILTFNAGAGNNATLTVDAAATGTKTFDRATSTTAADLGKIVLTSSLDVVHNGSGLLNMGNGDQVTNFGVRIEGAGGINKSGTGTLVLPGANTYGGSTAINNGVVNIRNSSALGGTTNGTSVASGAALQVQGGISVGAETLSLNGTGVTSTGALRNISGANSWAGAVTLAGASSVASDAGTITLSGGVDNGGYLFTVQGVGDTSVTTTGISGSGGLTKDGTGILSVSTANTYSGNTTVNAGKLVVNDSIGASAVSVNNTGTILATGTAASFGSTLAINAGAILAVGDAANTGTATATATGASTFADTSIFSWDIDAAGTAYDKLVTASLVDGGDTGGAVLRIVASDALVAANFWNTTKTWTDIFTTDGTSAIANWANIFTTVNVVNSTFGTITPVGGSFSASGNTLTWTAVPEPTSALAGILLSAGLLRRRRAGV